MGSSVIGALRVDMSANTAAFEAGMKQAEGILAGFGKGFAKNMAVVSAGIGAAMSALGIGELAKHAIDLSDELGKMAQKVGVPVEQLSALRYAAQLSDVSLEQLGGTLNRFNKNLGEIASGKTNAASAALEAIGVSARDANGNLRDTTDILLNVADRFEGYEDGANKSAIAMALFGKTGADLIPLLNQGSAGIKANAEEARRFGVIVSKEAAAAAEEFNDNLTRLASRVEGLAIQVAGPLVSAINVLGDAFSDLTASGSGFDKWFLGIQLLTTPIGALGTGLGMLARNAWAAETAIAGVADESSSIAQAMTAAPALAADQWKDLEKSIGLVRTANRNALDDLLSTDTTPFQDKFAAISAALQNGTIDVREFGQRWKDTNRQQEDAMLDLASTTSQALTTIFEDNKTAAIASAIINTLVGVTQALRAGPPPWNIAQAALIGAMGFAQVAKIRSTSKSSSASSATVTGGASTATADDVAASEAEPGRSTSIYVQGLGPRDLITGESLQAIIDGMKEYQRDGGQLIITGV